MGAESSKPQSPTNGQLSESEMQNVLQVYNQLNLSLDSKSPCPYDVFKVKN